MHDDDRTGRDLYLDLMCGTLTRAIMEDSDEVLSADHGLGEITAARRARRRLARFLRSRGYELVRLHPYEAALRENGRDWPARAETMMGVRRLQQLRSAVETVLAESVPGDLLEAGVWRGGGGIMMRAVLEAHGCRDRVVWLADSFQGLPAVDEASYPADAGLHFNRYSYLAVTETQVRDNFRRYGFADDRVRYLPGWFKDTLPHAPVERLSVLRLDGDLYQSTIEALHALYPKLSAGGFCIIDDYGAIRACRKAVHHYRSRYGIRDKIIDIDGIGAYWRKS
jgi:O-methyltransferase